MPPWMYAFTAGVGLVFVGLAIPLIRRRIPPNGLYGLRVPATFADEWVWYEANARSGWDLLYLGVVLTLLAVVLPFFGWGTTGLMVWAVAAVGGALAMAVIGWLRANRLLRQRTKNI